VNRKGLFRWTIPLALMLASPSPAPANGCTGAQCLILPVAGGAQGSAPSGDGGPALGALFDGPEGLGFDGAGNLYVADSGNQVIRRLAAGLGTVSTIAGQFRSAGGGGDGAAAAAAALDWPATLRVDAANNLYVGCGAGLATSMDNANNIRCINLNTGRISTFAGQANSFGPGSYGGDGGLAVGANLSRPFGVAVAPGGGIYISDTGNHTVRLVDPAGAISTVAGNHILGMGFSGDGGPATSAQLDQPMGLCLDADGNLYIADAGNARVRKVSPAGVISTVAGDGIPGTLGDGGQATLAELSAPYSVAVDSYGSLFIVDHDANRVREVDRSGLISTVAGGGTADNGDGGAVSNSRMLQPYDAVFDAANNLYVVERHSEDGAGEVREILACGCGATPTFSPTPAPTGTATATPPPSPAVPAATQTPDDAVGPAPNPFTPGLGAGRGTLFRLPAGHGPGRLTLFGPNGDPVYVAAFDAAAAVEWDGSSNAGPTAESGDFTFVIQADGRVWRGTVTLLR
jgi:sugar lactone lactonase YvrE